MVQKLFYHFTLLMEIISLAFNIRVETNVVLVSDWDNWNDTWVSEEDQWTGTVSGTLITFNVYLFLLISENLST